MVHMIISWELEEWVVSRAWQIVWVGLFRFMEKAKLFMESLHRDWNEIDHHHHRSMVYWYGMHGLIEMNCIRYLNPPCFHVQTNCTTKWSIMHHLSATDNHISNRSRSSLLLTILAKHACMHIPFRTFNIFSLLSSAGIWIWSFFI